MGYILKMTFGLFGVLSLIVLIYIDKTIPEGNPISDIVFYIIGGYILFVFIGPEGMVYIAKGVSEYLSRFKITIKKDEK